MKMTSFRALLILSVLGGGASALDASADIPFDCKITSMSKGAPEESLYDLSRSRLRMRFDNSIGSVFVSFIWVEKKVANKTAKTVFNDYWDWRCTSKSATTYCGKSGPVFKLTTWYINDANPAYFESKFDFEFEGPSPRTYSVRCKRGEKDDLGFNPSARAPIATVNLTFPAGEDSTPKEMYQALGSRRSAILRTLGFPLVSSNKALEFLHPGQQREKTRLFLQYYLKKPLINPNGWGVLLRSDEKNSVLVDAPFGSRLQSVPIFGWEEDSSFNPKQVVLTIGTPAQE